VLTAVGLTPVGSSTAHIRLTPSGSLDWLATGRTRKHLGFCCIRPFVRRLCLFSSVIYRGTRTAPSMRPPRGRAPNRSGRSVRPSRVRAPIRSGRTESSVSEEGKLWARNGRLNFALSIRLPRNRKGFVTCRKSTTRNPQLYFPSKGRHVLEFFTPEKNPTASAGFEPAILGIRGQHANY
jgi:hypothetical protein